MGSQLTRFGFATMLLALFLFGPSAPAWSGSAGQPIEIGLLGLRPGSSSYNFSQALANLVNKHSKKVSIQMRTTAGSSQHYKMMAKNPKERTTNLFTAEHTTTLWARKGIEVFKEPYTGARAISLFTVSFATWATYNPEIGTKANFAGKRIMIFPRFIGVGRAAEILINQIWKVGKEVTLSHGFPPKIVRALGDGLVDIGQPHAVGMPKGPWRPSQVLNQLSVLKPGLRFMGLSEEDLKAASEIMGVNMPSSIVGAGGLGATQKEPIRTFAAPLFWAADEAMDAEVVYEVTRILYQHMDEFNQSYPPSLLTRAQMAALAFTEDLFHPGAVKFYREMGIPIGLKQ